MALSFWKKTPVTLWHTTTAANAGAINRSGKIRGTHSDQNDACGRVGLCKIWTCAENANDVCCNRRGTERYLITASDLREISPSWSVYRTKNYDGYQYEGNTRVFYNFFLIPDSAPMPKKCMRKLTPADIDDDLEDPVQFFWDDGDMFILEKDVNIEDNMATTTTIETASDDLVNPDGERRSFHVAIVCWNLYPDSAQDDSTDEAGVGGDDMNEEDSTDVDDDTGEASGTEDNDANDTADVMDSDDGDSTSIANNYNINVPQTSSDPPLRRKPKRQSQYGTNAVSVVPLNMPLRPPETKIIPTANHARTLGNKCITSIPCDKVRKKLLRSVGTSKRALGKDSTERNEEELNFETASEIALDHATSDSPLTLRVIIEWHKRLLCINKEKAGYVRENSQARCGRRMFVRGEQVHSQLSCFLEALNEALQSCCPELDLAAWALWSFLVIHPFSDGNGRLGRLLVAWILTRQGTCHLIEPLCTPGKRRDSYIKALRQADSSGGRDLQSLVLHMKSCSETQ